MQIWCRIRKPIESGAMRVVNHKENDECCFLAILHKVEFRFGSYKFRDQRLCVDTFIKILIFEKSILRFSFYKFLRLN